MNDRRKMATELCVLRQLEAFAAERYEVGLIRQTADGKDCQRSFFTPAAIMARMSMLKLRNVAGYSINICPAPPDNRFVVLDDLTLDAVVGMKKTGYEPCVVVETSEKNYQAWLKYPRVFNQQVGTELAKDAARLFAADPGAASARHFGKLAGFTNRKPERFNARTGYYPFVKLVEATGVTFSQAEEQMAFIEQRLALDAQRIQIQQAAWRSIQVPTGPMKTIEDFRAKYDDGHRADLAYAIYALRRQLSNEEIVRAIASRDLTKKGHPVQQRRYIEGTIRKAHQLCT